MFTYRRTDKRSTCETSFYQWNK